MLNEEQKKMVLSVARESVEKAAHGVSYTPAEVDDEILKQKTGAFVTLYKANGDLRGCIGYITPEYPMLSAVAQVARAAALNDPRFKPLREEELEGLKIDISLLAEPVVVNDINEIEIGRDGLIISKGSRRGLLLPQVATKYGWSREEFLAQTCRKAHLPSNEWKKEGTLIEMFSAEVFGETEE